MQQSTAVTTDRPQSPAVLGVDSRSPPQTPVAASSTASSAVVSSVKRPYVVGDDTLPSPPAPPTPPSLPLLVQAAGALAQQRGASSARHPAALSGAQFAERWMASDVMEDGIVAITDDARATDAAHPRTSSAGEWGRRGEGSVVSSTRSARRHGSLVLVSPAPADDSASTTPPPAPLPRCPDLDLCAAAGAEELKGTAGLEALAPACAAPASAAAQTSRATPQEATAASPSVRHHSTDSFRSASPSASVSKRAASLAARTRSASAEGERHAAELTGATAEQHHPQGPQQHRLRCEDEREEVVCSLRRRLREAESFAAEQQTRCEAVTAEKEELHRRLTTLMGIEEELERRCQRQQAHAAKAEQRRASERRVLELEKTQAIAELTAEQARERRAWQEAASAAEALESEVAALRHALTEAQAELHTALEEQLHHQQRTAAATAAQASAESECATLRAEMTAVQRRATDAEAAAEVEHLGRALWGAEERAAAAELAIDALCEKLASAAAAAVLDPTEGSVECVTAGSDAAATQSALVHPARDSETVLEEGAVLAAAVAAMQRHGLAPPAVSAPASPIKTGAAHATPGSPGPRTPATAPSETEPSRAPSPPSPPRLSNAGRLCCRQHRQAVQGALARVREGRMRAAREATATADARAAETERVLAHELAELRARLTEAQAASKAAEHAPRAEPAHRSSVGINTASAAMPTTQRTTAAAAAQAGGPYAEDGDATVRDALVEAQRQLRHERGYVAQLEGELAALRASAYCASVLDGLSGTVQDMRVAVYRLVRDAVADMQRVMANEAAAVRGVERGSREDGDAGDGLRRRWRRMEQTPRVHFSEVDGASSSRHVDAHDPASSLLDFAFMRGIERAVLRTEAQVEQVRATLLPSYWHAQQGAAREGEQGQLRHASRLPEHTLLNTHDNGRPSHRLVERAVEATNANTPAPLAASPSCAAVVDGAGRRQHSRTAQQQQVYDDMRGLLARAAGRRHNAEAATNAAASDRPSLTQPVTSRYSPDASRWMSGVRPPPPAHPPPPLPSAGMNCSPASSPPYVSAYVQSPAARHRATHTAETAMQTQTDTHTLLRGTCASLTDVVQELRNVWQLLEGLREMEETRAARQRQCLVRWQEAILSAVDEVLRRVEEALVAAWRPRSDASVTATQRDAAQRERDTRLISPVRVALDVPAAQADDAAVRGAPQRLFRDSAEAEEPVRLAGAPSRLADVLSGRVTTAADAGGSGGGAARISSGAVVFA